MINLRGSKYRDASNSLYEMMFDEWVMKAKPENGDKFKVLRAMTPYEVFNDSWTAYMSKAVGKTLALLSANIPACTIRLEDGYDYPFYVLEKVEPKREKIGDLLGRTVRYKAKGDDDDDDEVIDVVFRQIDARKFVVFQEKDWNRFTGRVYRGDEDVPKTIGNYDNWELVID